MLQSLREEDFPQVQASGEGVVVDGLQPVREDDALDGGAKECGAADARDRVGQNNRFQRRTHESAFGDFGDAFRKMDDFSAVENGDIGGGDVVRFSCFKKLDASLLFPLALQDSVHKESGAYHSRHLQCRA